MPATRSFWRGVFERATPLAAAAVVALAVLASAGKQPAPLVMEAPVTASAVAEPEDRESRQGPMTCSYDLESSSSRLDGERTLHATTDAIAAQGDAKRTLPALEDAYAACLMPAPTHDEARAVCIAPPL